MRRILFLPLGLAAILVGAVVAFGSTRAAQGPVELLPDLDAAAPYNLVVSTSRGRFLLGFESAADNIGSGPLLVDGARSNRGTPNMRVTQRVRLSDGSERRYPAGGVLRYVDSADHSHWHLLPFMRYELRGAKAAGSAQRDRKTGFCLGDRYETDELRRLAGEPPEGVLVGDCGRSEPELLRVEEGISVGYGDNYRPNLEGQYLDVTDLPAGRYTLVHRVNGSRTVRERSYANNAASLLLSLRWQRGRTSEPDVATIARCPARDRCGV